MTSEAIQVPSQIQSPGIRGGVPPRPDPPNEVVLRLGGGGLVRLGHLDVGVVAGGGNLLRGVHDVVHGDHHVGLAGANPDISEPHAGQVGAAVPVFYVDVTPVPIRPDGRVDDFPEVFIVL